ncbi:AI-2E family transporter [Aquaspirillum serpens]|uniref:AI-2E family transporter n=1 Tax=Aquaspirillum serpens TaxID=190 RepID=UPI0003B50E75|nr:AI-2E family transporter [Aquaspirillum serpens]
MVASRRASSWWIGLAITSALLLFGMLMYFLGPILTPFVTAAVLAYITTPLSQRLQRLGCSAAVAAVLVTLLLGIGVLLMLLLLLPMLLQQGHLLSNRLPSLVDWLQNTVAPWAEQTLGFTVQLDISGLRQVLVEHVDAIRRAVGNTLPALTSQGLALLAFLANLILVPILFYYFLRDWQAVVDRFTRLIPPRWQQHTDRIAAELDRVLGEFLRGQLLVMLLMALIYGGGWWLAGLQSGLAIGVFTGLLVFIPYVGAFIGLGLATIAAILQGDGWSLLLAVWGMYAFGQLLESYLITPYLVGERIGLSPLEVIFALMAFGQLFGFVGVMIALPLAAIVRVLSVEGLQHYYASRFYQGRMPPRCL